MISFYLLHLPGALVHDVKFVNIRLGHLQSLPHKFFGTFLERHNGHLSVFRERISGVVQYTGVIIGFSVVLDGFIVVLVEVALSALSYVFLSNSDIVIAIPGALLVIEAKGMQELVDNCSQTEAAGVQSVGLQIQLLNPVTIANIRVTSSSLRGNIHIIFLISGGLLEDQARTLFYYANTS